MIAKKRHLSVEDYLDHIEQAATLATGYVRDMTRRTFLDDRKTQPAVIYNIMIIGEAATQIINEYPDFVAAHPDIPWREMRGIRNRMAHGYYELDLTIIWDTVTTYLDRLILQIASAKNFSSSY
ncbi:HepT-like ribonuclease domain-containing protein [Syntrophotalea acetylenica]|uniref:HepT-like ribonuclease domain-containing protein n=1 Tax=Syntrophotalea acetylenica TaxID=29542 RepID=UPI00090AEDDE|nr:DUF86 domain-containing protein [Syntrophotalea acetylenica]APG43781.1 hypothetical protein A6070_06345 [Syntrophotalea acetylenica]